jgi:hypothetical protein
VTAVTQAAMLVRSTLAEPARAAAAVAAVCSATRVAERAVLAAR